MSRNRILIVCLPVGLRLVVFGNFLTMDQLIKRRGSVKAKLTLFEKFIAKLEKSFPSYKIDDEGTLFNLNNAQSVLKNA